MLDSIEKVSEETMAMPIFSRLLSLFGAMGLIASVINWFAFDAKGIWFLIATIGSLYLFVLGCSGIIKNK